MMHLPPSTSAARVILLDIEGTTTPISFVYDVLFPFAHRQAANFLTRHFEQREVQADIAGFRNEHAKDVEQHRNPPMLEERTREAAIAALTAYVHWLMAHDRKVTPLKSLQGKIWEEGYRAGELQSQLFDDVPRAFARWQEQGKTICIYSSGSVLAQRLLFAHTTAGDLTLFIRNYFDTQVGAKIEEQSYLRIAAKLERLPSEILFISDVTTELTAARRAGLQTLLAVRPGNRPQSDAADYQSIHSFDAIE